MNNPFESLAFSLSATAQWWQAYANFLRSLTTPLPTGTPEKSSGSPGT